MHRLTDHLQQMKRRRYARHLKRQALTRRDAQAAAELSLMISRQEIEPGDVGMTRDEAMRFPLTAPRKAP